MLLRNDCQYGPFPCIKQICHECPHYFSQMGDQQIIDRRYESAIQEYLQAWELDPQSSLTARTLGNLYRQEQNFAAANEWYRRAADLDDSVALYCLAENTRDGRGTPRDLEEAILLFSQAARLGHPDARHAIGDLCVEQGLMKVDLAESLSHFRREAHHASSSVRQSWLDKVHAQNKINFESPELIQLSQMLEQLFPAAPSTKFSLENDIKWSLERCENLQKLSMGESTLEFSSSWIQNIALPELDPELARQTISLRQFARATQQYMIKIQNKHPQLRIDDFCAEISITRSYYYKIVRGERQPTRDTAIAMAVALGLNAYETQDYIMLLGDRLNEQLKRDWLILECIRRQYSIDQTGQILVHMGASPLVNIE